MTVTTAAKVPKRVRPLPASSSEVGSERDIRVLREIAELGMLATGQVERLGFPSRRRAQRRLRAFLDRGLVRAHLQGDALHKDNLWTITAAGLELLDARGVDVAGIVPHRPRARSQKLGHAIAVRDVAVSLLAAEAAGLALVEDIRLDAELAAEPRLHALGLVPDGYAVLNLGGTQIVLLWEVATEMQPLSQIRQKLLLYERAFAGGSNLLGSPSIRILVAVENETRLRRVAETASGLRVGERIAVVSLRDARDAPVLLARIGPRPAPVRLV